MSAKHFMDALCLAVCLAVGTASAAEAADAPASVMTMRVDGELAIDAQGKVLVYRIDTKLPPTIRAALDKAIATWSLTPWKSKASQQP